MDGRREISPSAFSKPSPWGPTPLVKGRWPKARGDRVRWPRRGRMRGQVSDCICCTQGSFAACGRRVTLPTAAKSPKRRRGRSRWTTAPPRSIGLLSPDPRYGGYPLKWAEHFRRAKSGVLGCGPVRPHWGPEREENWDCCGSASAPGFAEPTLPVCFLCRGDPRGRPQAFPFRGRPIPPVRGKWLKAKRGRGAGRQARRMR